MTVRWLLVASLATGCVGMKEHRALEDAYSTLDAEKNRLQQQLGATEMTAEELDARNKALAGKTDALASQNAALESDVARQARALRELQARQALAQQRVDDYKNLLAKFRTLIDAGTLTVAVVDGRMVVQLPTDILFPSGSAEMSAEGKTQLTAVGEVLAGLNREIQIEGHTDSDAISTARFPSNWELGSARATTVLKSLEKSGVPTNKMSTAGFADTRPVAPNDDAEGKRRNRRIEIALVPDLSLLPGFEELESMSTDATAETP